MIDLSRSTLRRGRGFTDEEEVTPMSGVANLADAMLVFSCGLMLAIATFWNVDLGSVDEVMKNSEVTEVGDVQKIVDQLKEGGSLYRELGTVYEDPASGKLYLITEDATDTPSAGGTSEGAAALNTNGGE